MKKNKTSIENTAAGSILDYLLEHPDTPVTYEEIIGQVWGKKHPVDVLAKRKFHVHCVRVRKRLSSMRGAKKQLVNLRDHGVMLQTKKP